MPLRQKLSFTFEVPLPPRSLSPNGAQNKRYTSSAPKREYRQLVRWAAVEAMQRVGWSEPCCARVSLTFGTGRDKEQRIREQLLPPEMQPYRATDVWNFIAAWKSGFDGLTDAGVWPDDSARWALLGGTQVDPGIAAGVKVFVEQWFR